MNSRTTAVRSFSRSWSGQGHVWARSKSYLTARGNVADRCSLAYAEMRLLLAKMLWHFDFELADSEDDWLSGLKAFMVWDKGILKVRLKPVEG